MAGEDEGSDAGRAGGGAARPAEAIRIVAKGISLGHLPGVVAGRAHVVRGPDAGSQSWRHRLVAREAAPDGVAEIAVRALLAQVVAGGDGHHLGVAGVAVVADGLVAVARREAHHAALSAAPLVHREVDGQPRRVGQRDDLAMQGIGGGPPVPPPPAPAPRDYARAAL